MEDAEAGEAKEGAASPRAGVGSCHFVLMIFDPEPQPKVAAAGGVLDFWAVPQLKAHLLRPGGGIHLLFQQLSIFIEVFFAWKSGLLLYLGWFGVVLMSRCGNGTGINPST